MKDKILKRKDVLNMDNMFFDHFSKKDSSTDAMRDETMKQVVEAVRMANECIRDNVQLMSDMGRVLYGIGKKRDEMENEETRNEEKNSYLLSFDMEDREEIDRMIADFIEHIKQKQPEMEIEIVDYDEAEDEDE